MDVSERIFKAAFTSLQGQPASSESFRVITRACIRCAAMWLDGLAQVTGALTDEQIVEAIADLARAELADIRNTGDRISFKLPSNSIQ
jgi:hypothetical protein